MKTFLYQNTRVVLEIQYGWTDVLHLGILPQFFTALNFATPLGPDGLLRFACSWNVCLRCICVTCVGFLRIASYRFKHDKEINNVW